MFKRFIIKLVIRWIRNLDDKEAKREILTEAVKHLFLAISSDDILKQNADGTWMFQGRPMLSSEVARLKEEAAFIRGMKLWLVIKKDIRWQLSKKMFEEANVELDLVWGKLLLYLDDCIRTRISKM